MRLKIVKPKTLADRMSKLSVRDLSLKGKRVLIRVDFNVPLKKGGDIADDTRIRAVLPTIRLVLEKGGRPILMSHLGRPKGERSEQNSLKPCARRLKTLLNCSIKLAPDCIGPETEFMAAELVDHEVLLLENLRFHLGEEHPDQEPNFVQQLARLGDCYVNDAFGTAHRIHASTVLLAECFPRVAAMGLLMEQEVDQLGSLLIQPQRPFVAIIGGAKVSTKLGVLKSLARQADTLIIGGGMAFTFFKARGDQVGNSLVEDAFLPEAIDLLNMPINLLLPEDVVIAQELKEGTESRLISISDGIPAGWMGVDIGPKTLSRWEPILRQAKTVFWNGPLGVFEISSFAQGTFETARLLSKISATTVVGGGDSLAAVNQAGVAQAITHLSTGGGATLEFLEFGTLPGLAALSDN